MSDGELRRIARRATLEGTDEALARLGLEYLRSQSQADDPFRMRVRMLGNNQTELETASHRILFSYETPVAFTVKSTGRWFRSAGTAGAKWSRTTVKHINSWFNDASDCKIESVPQSELESLLDV